MMRLAVLMLGAVAACVAAVAGAQQTAVSVWNGVYTAAQGKRGEELHSAVCVMCHGHELNGAGLPEMPPSPAIARAALLRKWSGANVAALFIYVRQTMPPDAPGTLSDQQTVDAIAHMFAVTGMPAGSRELPTDMKALANIVIQERAK